MGFGACGGALACSPLRLVELVVVVCCCDFTLLGCAAALPVALRCTDGAAAALAPGFVVTGFFFHQVHMADAKGWSLPWLATTFFGFALSVVATSTFTGPMVDRYRASKLLPFYLPPLGVAMLILMLFDHPSSALGYMVAAGMTVGAGNTLLISIWAEVYGTANLGAIRSLVHALMVAISALSPFVFGELFDIGVTIETVACACLIYIIAATVVLKVTFRDVPDPRT